MFRIIIKISKMIHQINWLHQNCEEIQAIYYDGLYLLLFLTWKINVRRDRLKFKKWVYKIKRIKGNE